MIIKLQEIINKHNDLANKMSNPDAMKNMASFAKMAREHSGMAELVGHAIKYIDIYNLLKEYEDFDSFVDHIIDSKVKEFCIHQRHILRDL